MNTPIIHSRIVHIMLIAGMILVVIMPSFSYCGSYFSTCPIQQNTITSCCPSKQMELNTTNIPVLIETHVQAACHHNKTENPNDCTFCNCTFSQSALDNSFAFTTVPQTDAIVFLSLETTVSFPAAPPNSITDTASAFEIAKEYSSPPIFIRFCSYLI